MFSIRSLGNTLGFLTRLAPARIVTEKEMNRCMAYMMPVGLILGVVLVFPFWLGMFSGSTWTQAFLITALNVYLTRGLHFDGLGDVCDAVTTHGDPERFWEVIKDSRAGAFAIIGLCLTIVGQIILFETMLTAGAYAAVAWAFVLGRAACVGFAYVVRHLARPGLGKLYMDGATLPVTLIASGSTFILGVFMAGPITTISAMFIATGAMYALYRLATRVDGVNGDFLGCSVLLGELAAGLGFALFL